MGTEQSNGALPRIDEIGRKLSGNGLQKSSRTRQLVLGGNGAEEVARAMAGAVEPAIKSDAVIMSELRDLFMGVEVHCHTSTKVRVVNEPHRQEVEIVIDRDIRKDR